MIDINNIGKNVMNVDTSGLKIYPIVQSSVNGGYAIAFAGETQNGGYIQSGVSGLTKEQLFKTMIAIFIFLIKLSVSPSPTQEK